MSEIAIKVNNVSKSFPALQQRHDNIRAYFWDFFKKKTPEEKQAKKERFWALKDINFEVKKGEFFGIIGKNGSGKSTLLKIIAGVYEPDTGGVEVNGRIIPFLELGVGFNPNLTARENVFLNGIIMGMTRKEVEEKYDEIFEFAELREFENLQLKKFSSGMQVRLAFAVAAQAKGDIYLLDEVFAVGDIGFQQKALKVIEDMIKEGKTFIYVGHGMDTMKKYAKNVLYIKDHVVEGMGEPYVIVNQYNMDILEVPETVKVEEKTENKKREKQEPTRVEVTKVIIVDENNKVGNTFLNDSNLKMYFKIKVNEQIESPVFGIAVYNMDNIYLYGNNTLLSGLKYDVLEKGEYTFDINIPKIPINEGDLKITFAITNPDNTRQYLWEEKKYKFSVAPTSKSLGIVDLKVDWELRKEK